MAKYVALLRGIAPVGVNMQNEKLRGVLEGLGFAGVQSVLSSGNIVFEAGRPDVAAWQTELEAAWPRQLGFESTTIIRSQAQLEKLLAANPFGGVAHGPHTYLLVTFFKHKPKLGFEIPFHPAGKTFRFVHFQDKTLCSITETTSSSNDPGGWIERQYGKEITSRTPLTVERIVKKMAGG